MGRVQGHEDVEVGIVHRLFGVQVVFFSPALKNRQPRIGAWFSDIEYASSMFNSACFDLHLEWPDEVGHWRWE